MRGCKGLTKHIVFDMFSRRQHRPFIPCTCERAEDVDVVPHHKDMEMTIPFERTRAVLQTRELLKRLMDSKDTPRVPRWLRGQAKLLLRHYPTVADIERVHRDVPDLFGPAPPI